MKKVIFHNDVLRFLQDGKKDISKRIGDLIKDLQYGKTLKMPESKPFNTIRKGVFELRIKSEDGIYRGFYYLKIKDKIIVFHVFKKKSQKTPKKEMQTAKSRLNEILEQLNE